MKLIWSLDEKSCVPLCNVKDFEIRSTAEYKNKTGLKDYIVRVNYTICTGVSFGCYTADTYAECKTWIENLYKEN